MMPPPPSTSAGSLPPAKGALTAEEIKTLTHATDERAWEFLVRKTLDIAKSPLDVLDIEIAPAQVQAREDAVRDMDLYLASCAWELWRSFGQCVTRTSARLVRWWGETPTGKAVLILDGLSLRELPWLLQGAQANGLHIRGLDATASELPADTETFASALGFAGRAALENNGAKSKLFPGARNESSPHPWKDCRGYVDSAPDWFFWHHWPDRDLHGDTAKRPKSLPQAVAMMSENLNCPDFWAFVKHLAKGRSLVITSDHGHAAVHRFDDAKGNVEAYLKKTFKGQRSAPGPLDAGPFSPPVVLNIGKHCLALGRWKWKVSGGYPAFAHGGLTLMECLSPWVEISENG